MPTFVFQTNGNNLDTCLIKCADPHTKQNIGYTQYSQFKR